MAELGGFAKPPVDGHVRIGSNTKTFTATLVLQLVAEGRIVLDTPAVEYLPEFGIDERITVRMLLQHTSGLFN
ncbi:serine hydrolase domain-containing protein, partial [Nocardia jinanensis]|uniref:serine hydrolase domain-containing protein n=1 Tax=Nocardia jinanensis TaxID=382504 RepID=UPI001F426B83